MLRPSATQLEQNPGPNQQPGSGPRSSLSPRALAAAFLLVSAAVSVALLPMLGRSLADAALRRRLPDFVGGPPDSTGQAAQPN